MRKLSNTEAKLKKVLLIKISMYSKKHIVSCTDIHDDVTDLVNLGIVKNETENET